MPKPPLPQIYCDIHVKPAAFDAFTKQGFKCIWIAKTKKYGSRDEWDYIEEIYAEGKLFATGDFEFVKHVTQNNLRHAGIVEIPPKCTSEEAAFVADYMADIIKYI